MKLKDEKMKLNLRVLIEPRGFIRIMQLVTSIFAIATTALFEAVVTFEINCRHFSRHVQYKFGYPFKQRQFEFHIPEKCGYISTLVYKTYTFPFGDFSIYAKCFLASGVLTLMFTAGIIFVYVFMHRLYSTNPKTPLVDLLASGVLSIFCFFGSCVWVLFVSGVKYYTNPANMFPNIDICMDDVQVCRNVSPGDFTYLYFSMSLGFANCMLSILSLWFVYKETSFHQKIKEPAELPQKGQLHAPPMQDQDYDQKKGLQY